MAHVEPRIAIPVQPRELLDFRIRRPLPRYPPNPAVPQSIEPVLVIPAAQPQKMTRAATQDHRRIRTTQSPSLNLMVKLLKALHPYRRSEERRVGKTCVRTCSSGWSPFH